MIQISSEYKENRSESFGGTEEVWLKVKANVDAEPKKTMNARLERIEARLHVT